MTRNKEPAGTMSLMEAATTLKMTYHNVLALVTRGVLDGGQIGGRYGRRYVTRRSVARLRRRLARIDG